MRANVLKRKLTLRIKRKKELEQKFQDVKTSQEFLFLNQIELFISKRLMMLKL
ncbi:hypothetical protein ACNANX_06885 [Campylobacter coli]